MQRFLEKTSRYICTQHQHNLADICVVLPNRRAGLFLKKIIPGIVEKTTWAPDIFSIEDFIIHLSGFSLADQIDLLFTLHQIHQDIEKEDTHSFEDFLSWGQLILSDFNDIDLHLADAKSLFTYLSEAKAIERWNPSSATLSESVKKYLRFYQSLIHYYTSLHGRCIANKSGYQGLIFKRVSGLIEQIIPNLKWQKVYFAGFNALTPSEQKIITALVESKKAEILWDADDYYVSNSMQEAGYFLRKEIEKNELKKFKWVDEGFRKIIKEVNLIGVSNNLGQARYAASVIGNWAGTNTTTADTLSNAALVLTDENLLFPVLNSLHDNTPKFNVTMGLPIKLTVVFQLFNHIIRAFENADRYSISGFAASLCSLTFSLIILRSLPMINIMFSIS
jgi:ATP-dependent helicase/nuclease subunit B